jgi:hypothetical protein
MGASAFFSRTKFIDATPLLTHDPIAHPAEGRVPPRGASRTTPGEGTQPSEKEYPTSSSQWHSPIVPLQRVLQIVVHPPPRSGTVAQAGPPSRANAEMRAVMVPPRFRRPES